MTEDKQMDSQAMALTFKDYEGLDYEQFWKGPGKEHLDRLERQIIASALPGGDSIADIGAGFGRLGGCYINNYRNVHMIEPASNLRDAAAKTYGDSVSYNGASVYELPFEDASFDAIVMIRVLHHLGSPEKALREVHRVLETGGVLLFSYSNKRNLKRMVQFGLRKKECPFTLQPEPYHSTFFGHHPAYIDDLVQKVGFNITAEFGVGVIDKAVEVLPALGKLVRPSVALATLLGRTRLAPYQFIRAEKK